MKKGGKQKVIQEKINFLSGGNYFCKQGRKWIRLNFLGGKTSKLVFPSYKSLISIHARYLLFP